MSGGHARDRIDAALDSGAAGLSDMARTARGSGAAATTMAAGIADRLAGSRRRFSEARRGVRRMWERLRRGHARTRARIGRLPWRWPVVRLRLAIVGLWLRVHSLTLITTVSLLLAAGAIHIYRTELTALVDDLVRPRSRSSPPQSPPPQSPPASPPAISPPAASPPVTNPPVTNPPAPHPPATQGAVSLGMATP